MLSRDVPGSSPGIFKKLFRPRLDRLTTFNSESSQNDLQFIFNSESDVVSTQDCYDFEASYNAVDGYLGPADTGRTKEGVFKTCVSWLEIHKRYPEIMTDWDVDRSWFEKSDNHCRNA